MLTVQGELETEDNNCTSLWTPLKDDNVLFKHMSTYQERYLKNKTSDHQVQLQLSTWQKASDPLPNNMSPNLKNRFIHGNPWLGGFCSLLHQELKITWEGQELIRQGDFPCNRTAKCPRYLMDWKRAWLPPRSNSCALRLLTSLWCSSPPSKTLGGTRRHLSERSNPGIEKSLDSFQ